MRAATATVAVGVLLVAGGCGTRGGDEGTRRMLEAAEQCDLKGALTQHGRVLNLDSVGLVDARTDGNRAETVSVESIGCALGMLGVPEDVAVAIETTDESMGEQTAQWDGIVARWAYGLGRGLDVVLTDTAGWTGA